jgi:uncharacterized membrane protein
MENRNEAKLNNIGKKMRDQLITGLLILAPIGIAVWILVWIFLTVDDILQPILMMSIGRTIPGVGFGITILIIYIVGVTARSVVGRRFILYSQHLIAKIPVFRPIYTTIKQITESFSGDGQTTFTQVVLVEFPRKGMQAVAFVTNEWITKSNDNFVSIYIPTSPNPTSGFFQIVHEKDIIRTDITVSEAMKSVISAGKVPLSGLANEWPTGGDN